ncbi:MAG TPA: sugar ABC transporter ATP-binding protein [Actinokineospora sp.]|nr:sugar ABC transporter ATP-binding protein [Actinokineospora sp.]
MTPLLRMDGIVKEFPGVRALDGVDLEVVAGEVHCLLGQNGAGKSTLIKTLAGASQPDGGVIHWDGQPVSLGSPQAAMRLGITTIYQELDLVDGLTVAENIFLGHEIATAGFVRRGEVNRRARDLLTRLGHAEIRATREVGELPPAHQQVVSMARALSHDTRLLVLDEPSAVLDQGEVENLFRVIRGLTAQGVAVVYISHRLDEIRAIGDRVTVLKDGATVATGLSAKDTPTAELITLMTGRTLDHVFPDRGERSAAEPVLEVRDLACGRHFAGIDLTVRAGEVVGLAGLVGSGRSEILETIYGARVPTAGTVRVAGKRPRPGSVTSAVRAGMGLCPEERKSQGLLLDQSVARNITVSTLSRFATAGFLDNRAERAESRKLADALELRPRDVTRVVRTLSGGNQQKVVLARWLLRECRVLLLDEPTRGVDVGARREIYELIHRLAAEGVAVLVVSSEVEEVLGLADRVVVIREGRAVHEGPADELTESKVLDLVMEGSAA